MRLLDWILGLFILHIGGGGGGDGGAAMQAAEEERKNALRTKVNSLFGTGGEVPPEFLAEEASLAGGLRDKYTDESKRAYEDAERRMRFGAANTGNIGGTAYADAQARLAEDNRTGGTRIEDAVQRQINSLRAAREGARLNSIALVNSGSGPEAVEAAAAGLRGSLDTARSAARENITGDLFQGLAFTKGLADAGTREQQMAALYGRPKSSATFAPSESTGRIIRGY